MDKPASDAWFAGAIPEVYEKLLVPLIFAPYADDIVERLAHRRLGRVLEIAAGTGVVTRLMASRLPADVRVVATDLNQAMLDHAVSVGTERPVEWRQADAMTLPFPDASFDAVVCQFGVMFFPDRAKAYAEARRVLAPGGVFLFNAWDRIEANAFPETVVASLATLFPLDPPRFLARVPHGYHDLARIGADLAEGGFENAPRTSTVPKRSRAASARVPATAFCLGTPMRSEIEARDATKLEAACDVATRALEARFGLGAIDGAIQAHVIEVER